MSGGAGGTPTLRGAAVAMAAAWCAGTAARAAEPVVASGQRDTLLQAIRSWNGNPYARYPDGQPQLTVIRLRIAPHTALPWHTHPVPNAGFVLSGELTIQDRDSGRSRTFRAGEAFAESVDDVHRGMAGDAPVVLILFYPGVAGMPTSIPARGEKAEY